MKVNYVVREKTIKFILPGWFCEGPDYKSQTRDISLCTFHSLAEATEGPLLAHFTFICSHSGQNSLKLEGSWHALTVLIDFRAKSVKGKVSKTT